LMMLETKRRRRIVSYYAERLSKKIRVTKNKDGVERTQSGV
jgi:hypothetical protein